MANSVEVQEVRARIRELGEHRSSYISDAALNREIGNAYRELYEKLANCGANDYFESVQDIDVVSGTSSYDLPSDYLYTLGVDIKRTSDTYINIPRYQLSERNEYSVSRIGAVSREWSKYRIRGSKLTIIPEPNWTETGGIRHYYVSIPSFSDPVADDDTLDGINGWEDWIVYKCLILFAGKEESDPSLWIQLLAAMDQRIEEMKTRDRANPGKIRDIDAEAVERLWPRYGPGVSV